MTDRPTTSFGPARRRVGPAVASLLAAAGLLLGATACNGDTKDAPTATVTLPATFPKGDVPLVDGNLIDAGERSQGGVTVFNVTVQAKPEGYDEAKKKLVAAGYTALGDGAGSPDSRSAQFSGKGYIVTVNAASAGAIPNAVFYLVSKG
ncbi:hypothetical protein [Tsukamurella sp. NPDC003166]|uniref:hypothetical protein n=1 Tax=Tsukamurella sp. NPDC003166 TaxID=3154444 RepID=UPI0033AAF72C